MCKQILGNMPPAKKKAKLILQDGSEFEGYSFGADTSIGGEVGMYIISHVFSDCFTKNIIFLMWIYFLFSFSNWHGRIYRSLN